jgi:hypothetical protein
MKFSINETMGDDTEMAQAMTMPIARPVGFGEALGAAYELSAREAPLGLGATNNEGTVARIAQQMGADSVGRKLPKEELEEKYPDLKGHFDQEHTEAGAELIAKNVRRVRELEETVARGPKGFIAGTSQFAAALVPHAIDPVNLASGYAVGVGLKAMVNAKKFAKIGQALAIGSKAQKPAQAFVENVIEGAVGNFVVEPLNYAAGELEDSDYSVSQGAMNTIGSAVGFAGIGYLGRKSINALSRMGDYYTQAVGDSAMAQTLNGQPVNVKPLFEQYVYETNTHMPEYSYVPHPTEKLHEQRLFTASEKSVAHMNEGTAVIGEFYGSDAVYLTDSEGVANGAASRSTNAHKGSVFEVKAKEPLNIIDLDKPLEGPAKDVFKTYLDSAAKVDTDLETPLTGKQILDVIHDAIDRDSDLDESLVKSLQDELKLAGYDGFRHDGSQVMGLEHSKHNALVIFNKDKIEMVRRSEPGDWGKVEKEIQAKAVAKKIADDQKEEVILKDKKAVETHDRIMKNEDFTIEDSLKEIDQEINDLKGALEREGKAEGKEEFIHPEDKQGLEYLSAMVKEGREKLNLVKNVAKCLLTGGA